MISFLSGLCNDVIRGMIFTVVGLSSARTLTETFVEFDRLSFMYIKENVYLNGGRTQISPMLEYEIPGRKERYISL